MYLEQRAVFIYCVSPVHMGAGTALGVIDNPIQRERHTEYPIFAGSGLKGAVRHYFWAQAQALSKENHAAPELVKGIFGPAPEDGGADYAGAISFSDAQLVCFPVRSIRQAFLYTTSPTALARAKRTLSLAGQSVDWLVPQLQPGECCLSSMESCTGNCLPLEAFEFQARQEAAVEKIAGELARMAFPANDAFSYFAERMKNGLVVLHDEDFGYFVRNATVVEPHVRIDDVTGTADDGGLFYTENLPPESLLLGTLMASDERRAGNGRLVARDVIHVVAQGDKGFTGLNERMIQVGGDATTGRGQVVFKTVEGV